nr:branched-chain amino acid transport ATP-binding protein LivG [uncultured bacterium]
MHLLETQTVCQRFGSFRALNDVNLCVAPRCVHALIGPNGAGKSSLMNVLAGAVAPASGKVLFKDRDVTAMPVHRRALLGIGRSYQVVKLFEGLTCQQVAEIAVQRDLPSWRWLMTSSRAHIQAKARALLESAGLAVYADVETNTLAHGIQKRLEIALAVANDAQLLLLDEPMAGLTAHERVELATLIRSLAQRSAVVFVEHDMDMVMSLADRISVLHNGELIAEGTPDEIRADETVQRIYLHRERHDA